MRSIISSPLKRNRTWLIARFTSVKRKCPMALDSQWLNWLMRRTKTLLFLQHRQPSTPSFQPLPKIWNSHMRRKKSPASFPRPLICGFNFFQQMTSSILPLRKTWKKWGDTSSSMMRSTSQLAWMKCVSTDRFTVPCQIEAKLQASSFRSFTWQWGVCFSCLLLLQFQNDTQSVASYFSYHFFAEDPIWSNLLLTSICPVWFSAQVPWCTSHLLVNLILSDITLSSWINHASHQYRHNILPL